MATRRRQYPPGGVTGRQRNFFAVVYRPLEIAVEELRVRLFSR